MGEKTEKATPKKLKDAKKKGQIAKSEDLPHAFTFIVSVSIVLYMASFLYHQLTGFMKDAFQAVTNSEGDIAVASLFYKANEVIFMTSLPILLIVSIVGVTVTFLAVGPVFAPEVFKFDIQKFNPITNLKNKFKLKTLIELIKSCLKISIAGYIIYTVMYKSIPVLIHAVSMPIIGSLSIFSAFLIEVVAKVGLFFIVIAVADFVYQKKNFAKEMKMEKFEVKQEHKNSEGDPQIKGKRRQIAQEIAYSEGPAGNVKKAQAVITNPTHLAIAIAYEKDIDAAPYILGMGQDFLAETMVKLAEKYNVPVLRNIPLAHKLWEEGEAYEYVPEETYEALAEVIRWIDALKDGTEIEESIEL
jgi:type III secretion protein U